MTLTDRWLLPDGVEEILPETARRVETLRRDLLDVFHHWGYELVIPPVIEFADSLLIGLGSDMDLDSFKVVDQISGRTLALRPDITPQVARIDAHSLAREGTARLCYAGTVVHTRPRSLLASRAPTQVGAELYGEIDISADIEIVSLMIETLQAAGLEEIYLDLGHIGIFSALAESLGLSQTQEKVLFDALQRKSQDDIYTATATFCDDIGVADKLILLANMYGDASVLDRLGELFDELPQSVLDALAELRAVAEVINQRFPAVKCYFDLAELRGWHYHTGLMFAAYAPGHGQAVANGGRYNDIGEVFGRARPATGFSTELQSLARLGGDSNGMQEQRVFAAYSEQQGYWDAVQGLRQKGEVVIAGLPGQGQRDDCQAELVWLDGSWQVQQVSA
ncbi:MAG: ATP phosphoribosyltransferase regulatory subunit [Pseudomonadales bacterium]